MYNLENEITIEEDTLTVGTLINALSKFNSNTPLCITGENYCYIMEEEDGSVVNIDVLDADTINN